MERGKRKALRIFERAKVELRRLDEAWSLDYFDFSARYPDTLYVYGELSHEDINFPFETFFITIEVKRGEENIDILKRILQKAEEQIEVYRDLARLDPKGEDGGPAESDIPYLEKILRRLRADIEESKWGH